MSIQVNLIIPPRGWAPDEPLCEEFAAMEPGAAASWLGKLEERCREAFMVATGQAERRIQVATMADVPSPGFMPGIRRLNGGRGR